MLSPPLPSSSLFPYTTLFRSNLFDFAPKPAAPFPVENAVYAPHIYTYVFNADPKQLEQLQPGDLDRKSTRLNSSHVKISYAVFCLKKKRRIEHVPLCISNSIR